MVPVHDPEASFRRLTLAVELSPDPVLALIEVASPRELAALRARLDAFCEATGRPFRAPPGASSSESLLHWLAAELRAAVERPEDEAAARPLRFLTMPEGAGLHVVLRRLNENRNKILEGLRGALCLVGEIEVFQRGPREAPDLWSMRTVEVAFPALPAPPGVELPAGPPAGEEPGEPYDAFIVAAFRDEAPAGALAQRLAEEGVRCRVHRGAASASGPARQSAFDLALAGAQFVIPLLSPDFVTSRWPLLAASAEMMTDPEGLRGRTLPVLLRDCVPPGYFRSLRFIDLRTEAASRKELPRLVRALRREYSPPPASELHVDVLFLTVLAEELEAVLALGAAGAGGWKAARDRRGFRYHYREILNERGLSLRFAAASTGTMDEPATAARVQGLIEELTPRGVALTGMCAGRRGEVSLGDVIVADRIYRFDHGKLIAADEGRRVELHRDLATYHLDPAWKREVALLAREPGWKAALLEARPSSPGAPEPPLQVHVGAIAVGETIREDPEVFGRLERHVGRTLGLAMEATSIEHVVARAGTKTVIAKAVSDFADAGKDESSRAFACRASAEFLLALFRRCFDPEPRER